MNEISDRLRILKLIQLSGGEIEGRVKLQKIAYLLNQVVGIKFQNIFSFYHFGPFSKGLAEDATWLSRNMNPSDFEEKYPTESNYNYVYLTHFSAEDISSSDKIFGIPEKKAEKIVKELNKKSKDVLELSSTIVFLVIEEGFEIESQKLMEECEIRKPSLMGHYREAKDIAIKIFNVDKIELRVI